MRRIENIKNKSGEKNKPKRENKMGIKYEIIERSKKLKKLKKQGR